MPGEYITDDEITKILDFMNIDAERMRGPRPKEALRLDDAKPAVRDEPVDMMLREALLPGGPWSAKVDKTGKATFAMETPEMEAQREAGKAKSVSPAAERVPKETSTAPTATPPPSPQIPFSAYASMMAPSIGPSPAELKGLTPEQVMSVMDAMGVARETGRKTMADIEGWGLGEAQRRYLEARTREALAPDIPTAKDVALTDLARKRKEVARPPLTFKQRMELKKAGPPRDPKEPSVFEQKMPITAHDTMVEAIMDKDGNLFDYPDGARVSAANKVFEKHGLEIIGVDIEKAKRSGWLGIDWLAKDIPARTILVVTEEDQEPTRRQVGEALVSFYGWSPEEVGEAKIESRRRKRKGVIGK